MTWHTHASRKPKTRRTTCFFGYAASKGAAKVAGSLLTLEAIRGHRGLHHAQPRMINVVRIRFFRQPDQSRATYEQRSPRPPCAGRSETRFRQNSSRRRPALIDSYVAFSRFAVQTVARGYEAVIAANATLALGSIECFSHTAQAWTPRLWPDGAHSRPRPLWRGQARRPRQLVDASLDISRQWTTEVTRSWAQAASAYVRLRANEKVKSADSKGSAPDFLIPQSESTPDSFHVALHGNGINGLEGLAGVCLFLFDPSDNAFAFKIKYYPGIAAGHAVSVNPAQSVGLLGNTGQHLLFSSTTLRQHSTRSSGFPRSRSRRPNPALQGSTHAVWLSDSEFITAIGEHFYRFHTDSLARPECLGPHLIKLPHAIKLTHSRRYLVYGGMDHPWLGEARRAVGIFSFETGKARRLQLPATCWHVLPHPTDHVFYAITFRVAP